MAVLPNSSEPPKPDERIKRHHRTKDPNDQEIETARVLLWAAGVEAAVKDQGQHFKDWVQANFKGHAVQNPGPPPMPSNLAKAAAKKNPKS